MDNEITDLLQTIVRFLSAGIGIVIAIMVVVGAIQYITAAGNPQKVAAAKGRIGQALLGLFLYVFGLAILQWLVPGTIIST